MHDAILEQQLNQPVNVTFSSAPSSIIIINANNGNISKTKKIKGFEKLEVAVLQQKFCEVWHIKYTVHMKIQY